jgi:imidazolonepropionase-like amidohydrolase
MLHGGLLSALTYEAVSNTSAEAGDSILSDHAQVAPEEAARHGLKVAAHAHGTEGILAAVKAGVASIEHGSMIDDEAIRLMKERGTYLGPTAALGDTIDVASLPPAVRRKAESVLPMARANVRKAAQAGVKIALGTDAPLVPFGDNAKEFGAMADRGLRPSTPFARGRSTPLNSSA